MTIDEAIKLCEEGSKSTWNGHQTTSGKSWQQMAEWLKDYKRLLGAIDAIKADIEELSKQPDFGDLSVGVSCGAIRCLEMINKHIEGDAK